MKSMGVATECGCKEVYRFPHTLLILVSVLFYSSIIITSAWGHELSGRVRHTLIIIMSWLNARGLQVSF